MDAIKQQECYKFDVAGYRQDKNKSDDPAKKLLEGIERRKQHGSIPAAMPHGIRS